jgi:pimeloyl-ACP methyl ester carboxylesterase
VLAIAVGALAQSAAAQPPSQIGIVIMHGKGGSPTGHVAPLASALDAKGYLVANIEMPWSGSRSYDAAVADAEAQVESALDKLRSKGARKLFVAGHSQGGLFALHFGGKHSVDGIIAIAPGGNAASPTHREKLGASVAQARRLIADGKGNDRTRFLDFEGSRGTYSVVCTPANYLSWFDPDGAMNELMAVRRMNPQVPVLFVVPTGDYPPLQNAKQLLFGALPPNALTELYEPASSHLDAPSASVKEIERWIAKVVGSAGPGAAAPIH